MRRVVVFDVNETLLDLKALDPVFARIFGDVAARREWFAQFLQSAFVATITDAYRPFGQIGMAALEMVAARRGTSVSDEERRVVANGMASLPPHPEVRASLERLRDAGFRLAALTNSTVDVAEAQLANAGLRDQLEQVLSADAAGRLKPAPEPYRMAAERLGVEVAQVRLVAAHAWDVAGALRAGCAAAFVARPGMATRSPRSPTSSVPTWRRSPSGSSTSRDDVSTSARGPRRTVRRIESDCQAARASPSIWASLFPDSGNDDAQFDV